MSEPRLDGSKWRPTTEKLPTRSKSCHACRETVITGVEDGVGPTNLTLDPHPLTVEGELLALATGHNTYSHSPGFELTRRDVWAIETINPEPPQAFGGYTVHAAHRCGAPPFPHYPPLKKTKRSKTERPPY